MDKDTITITGNSSSNDTITITGNSSSNNTIVINLDETYGATTSYSTGGLSIVSIEDTSTYTIDPNTWNNGGLSTINSINISDNISVTDFNWRDDTYLEVAEVEKMCAEYPALAKVYENFKTVYDLVKQDWKGKLDAENNS